VIDRITITVPGEPQSQDRRTRQLRAKDGRTFSGTYLLAETREWREAERAYEAACVYVRCFCDQFKTSPQKARESPGGVQERADAEKHTP